MVGARAWSQVVQATIQSSNDSLSGNNQALITLTALPLVELTVTAEPSPAVIPLGGTVSQFFTLHSTGPQPVVGASVILQPYGGIQLASVSGTGAQCTLTTGTGAYRCTYDAPIESGGSRRLDVQLLGVTVGVAQVSASASAPDSQHLPNSNVDTVFVRYAVNSLVDVGLNPLSARFGFDHRPTGFVFHVVSHGATPALNTQFTLPLATGLHAATANSSIGGCTIGTTAVTCSIGTLAVGATAVVIVEMVSDNTGTFSLAPRITADGDSDATNNATTVDFIVQPYLDVALQPLPTDPHVRAGSTIDYPVALRSATQPVTGTAVFITVNSGITVLSATPSLGSCEPASSPNVRCTLGDVPANAVATVVLRVRGDVAGQTGLRVDVSANGDADGGNNSGIGTVFVDQRGDVAVQSASASVTATVGTAFDFPRITVSAVTTTDDVRVALAIPSSFSIDSATSDNGPCAVDAGSISCSFGTLECRREPRHRRSGCGRSSRVHVLDARHGDSDR